MRSQDSAVVAEDGVVGEDKNKSVFNTLMLRVAFRSVCALVRELSHFLRAVLVVSDFELQFWHASGWTPFTGASSRQPDGAYTVSTCLKKNLALTFLHIDSKPCALHTHLVFLPQGDVVAGE